MSDASLFYLTTINLQVHQYLLNVVYTKFCLILTCVATVCNDSISDHIYCASLSR